jgi:hypothetical protein
MNLGAFSTNLIGLSATFTPWLFLAIFVITLVAQFGFFVPYLLESIWLFSGYNVVIGAYSPFFLVALCIVGIIGREVGSSVFFYVSSLGSQPLQRFYQKHIEPRFLAKAGAGVRPGLIKRGLARFLGTIFINNENEPPEIFGKPIRFSPFMVALGHFLWLRVPIIMTLGLKGKMKPLLLGVALFSILYDGLYIFFGILGGTGGLNRTLMLVYPLGLMALIFGTSYGVRRVGRQAVTRD